MSSDFALALCAFGIGIVAGLRSLTAPAAVSWAAHLHWLDLRDSRLACSFHDRCLAVSALGLGELIADKLSFVPNRTSPFPMASAPFRERFAAPRSASRRIVSFWREPCSAG